MKTKIIALSLLGVFVCSFVTCLANDKLHRNVALKLLKIHYGNSRCFVLREGSFPPNDVVTGVDGYTDANHNNNYFALRALDTAGYIEMKGVRGGTVEIKLTKKGRATFKPDPTMKDGWKVIIGGYVVKKVTGIFFAADKTTAEVEYTMAKELVVPKDILDAADNACLGCLSRLHEENCKAFFKLYDDGWRFVKELDQ
jgi:hypothetical protein